MKPQKISFFAFCSILLFTFSCSSVKTEEVSKMVDGKLLKGAITYDSEIPGPRPGVIIFHEWAGQNEYARDRARHLAKLGYSAITVDMEGDVKQTHHLYSEGKPITAQLADYENSRARFLAAEQLFRAHPTVDNARISVIGYCFGGGVALNMARQGADFKVVVSYHGDLRPVIRSKKGGIKSRLFVFHGGDDKVVSPAELADFKKEMTAADARMVLIEFKGAAHGFTNPHADDYARDFNLPIAYNKEASERSWEEMSKYLHGRM